MYSKNRKNPRLKNYDLGSNGLYFVTILTKHRECHFGKIDNEQVVLSDIGNYAKKCWMDIPNHFPFVKLHNFVVMPNHIHGIIEIAKPKKPTINLNVLEDDSITLKNKPKYKKPHIQSRNIPSIVRGFKIGVTKYIRNHTHLWDVWHRGYYLEVLFKRNRYHVMQNYIKNNPKNWKNDDFY